VRIVADERQPASTHATGSTRCNQLPVRLLYQSVGVRQLAPDERRGHRSGTRAETRVEPSPRVVSHEGEPRLVAPLVAAAYGATTRTPHLPRGRRSEGGAPAGAHAAPGRDEPRRAELFVTGPIREVAHEGERGRVLPVVATRTQARDHELAVVLPHDGDW